MSLFTKIKEKKRLFFGTTVAVFASLVFFAGVLPNVFADTAYYLANAAVELDGANNGEVTISFNTPIADSIFSVRGIFDTTAGGGNFTLTSLTPPAGITPNSNSVADGTIYWYDSTWVNPIELGERESMWSATYTVNKDTPADSYSICMSDAEVASLSLDYDTAWLGHICSTVTVTRNDTPATKPSQVVTFRDGENNPITEITKYYGDDNFTITKEVTTGDGAITQYHPDDDGIGTVAHTVPDSDLVGVGVPGDVEICAWVAETENYAETKSCYTVHVLKRPLDIIGATIADKTYDGSYEGTVTSVAFSDRDLTSDQYTATATFADNNAGENKAISVSVTLVGTGAEYYTLNASTFNTTKTISKYQLTAENVTLDGGSNKVYTPGGVEPTVTVTANTHGGLTTLTLDTDYEVAYFDNENVGAAHLNVTGKGNFTTGETPIVLYFNIEARGINNDNLVVPEQIIEGRILAIDEISVVVDGTTLTRCANGKFTGCDYTLEIAGDNDGVAGHTVHIAVYARNNYTGVGVKDVAIVAKLAQTVSFGDVTGTTIEKEYRDANFTYTATTSGDGGITYSSSNPDIVSVNLNTGEVEVKGVGTATITATAAETDTYALGTASYNVTVLRKLISVTDVTFRDKVYDGTPNAEIESLVLSDESLVFG